MSTLLQLWGIIFPALKILGLILAGLGIAAVVIVVIAIVLIFIAGENGENPFQ